MFKRAPSDQLPTLALSHLKAAISCPFSRLISAVTSPRSPAARCPRGWLDSATPVQLLPKDRPIPQDRPFRWLLRLGARLCLHVNAP